MRISKEYLILFFFTLVVSNSLVAQEINKSPNVVLILADDLGYGDIQALNSNSKIPTPHINSLAKNGISFTNAHSPASVCTPTRYSILTGKYPWRSTRKKGVSWVWDGPMIDNSEFTIGTLFKEMGYKTACIGKWHLGLDWPTFDGLPATGINEGRHVNYAVDLKNGPLDHGFDFYFGQDVPGFPPHGFIENRRMVEDPTDWFDRDDNGYGFPFGISGVMTPDWDYSQQMSKLTEKAIQWINLNSESPFFLYFAMTAPHTPIVPDSRFLGKTEVGRYGDFVYEMDYHLGRLMQSLKDKGLDQNTLVIFTSDNGPLNADESGIPNSLIQNHNHNSSATLRGMKSDSWEGGHRIPFLASWPGVIQQNTTSDALISQVDFMETFASLLKYSIQPEQRGDGYDISNALMGKNHVARNQLIAQSGNGILSIQTPDWKLILSSGGGGNWSPAGKLPERILLPDGSREWKNIQLYKVSEDLKESSEISKHYPDVVNQLMAQLKKIILKGISQKSNNETIDAEFLWDEISWIQDIEN